MMQRSLRRVCLPLLVGLVFAGAPRAAMAACTSPAGIEGQMQWNFTTHVLNLCDGTNWMAAGKSSSGTAGYVQFSDGSGGFSSDSTSGGYLYWDSTNHRLGIGTASPSYRLHVAQTDTSTSGTPTMMRHDFVVAPSANSSATFTAQTVRADVTGSFDVTGALVSNSGYLSHSGSGTVASAYGSLNQVDNASTGTITSAFGAYNYARANSAGSITSAYGARNLATSANASSTIGTAYGALNESINTTGTITTAYGAYDNITHSAPTTMSTGIAARASIGTASGATITNAYGVAVYLANSGTVANWYGLYIPALTGTAPTTNRFPIYVADTGSSYFAGNVGIGTTSPAYVLHVVGANTATSGSPANVRSNVTATPASASSATTTAGIFAAYGGTTSATVTGGLQGIAGSATNNATANDAGVLYGAYLGAYNVGTGTATSLFGAYGRADNGTGAGAVTNSYGLRGDVTGAGTVTNAFGVYAQVSGTGTITKGYGLYISSVAGTTAYSLYANDATAPSYFAGNVGIGRTSAQATLDVNGYMRLAKNAAQPVACAAGNDGAIALTSQYTICACKSASTAWVKTSDGTTACVW